MSQHPQHLVGRMMATPGYYEPAQPLRAPWGLQRWRIEWACRKRGGHWWHPEGMIGWFCCQCGAERDGMPKDGE